MFCLLSNYNISSSLRKGRRAEKLGGSEQTVARRWWCSGTINRVCVHKWIRKLDRTTEVCVFQLREAESWIRRTYFS